MKNSERLILIGSIALNVVLIITLLIIWPRGARPSPPAISQIEATSLPTSTAQRPTTTPTAVPEPTTTPTTQPSPTPEPTAEPTPEPTAEPTPEPTMEPTPEPTAEPTPEPIPTATFTLTGPNWLRYANQFRLAANLPLLTENRAWSQGAANHSFYMVANSDASHNENRNALEYTPEGEAAGQNGNIAVSGSAGVGYTWPFDYWMSASFHAMPILDPQLQEVGYGDYRNPNSSFGLAATLDINRGLRGLPPEVQFPIIYPQPGGQTWITTFNLPEFPDTLAGCPGYTRPTGAPIIVQIGPGTATPRVSSSQLTQGGNRLDHCLFTETTYTNNNNYWQTIGRQILDERDAIVLVPRSPLRTGQTYAVTLVVDGQEIAWQFDVVAGPPPDGS